MGEITMRFWLRKLGWMFVEGATCKPGEALVLKRGLPMGSRLKSVGIDGEDLVMVYEHDEVDGQVEVRPEFEKARFEWHRF